MRHRRLAAAALVVCLGSFPALALDVSIEGAGEGHRRLELSPDRMSSLATTLVLEDGTRAQGFALGELLPLFSEVWKLEASGGEAARPNKVAWSDEDLAERLFSIYLVQTAPAARARGVASWDLVVGRERFAGVRDLTLRGELLDEDDLEVWLSWEGVKELKAEIARFAEAHGKRIRATEVPNTQTKLLTVARAGGRLPDLAMIQSDYVPELVGGRLLQAVDYFRDSGLEAKGYEAFSAAGHAWALPFYFDTQLVFYNRALVGSPPAADWTLDDLVARARSLKGRVRAPLAWNLWSAYWLLPFMAGYGKASIVDADGGMTVDDAPTRQALSTLKALMEEGLLVPAERDAMMSWFASGQAGFILAGSYSIPEFSGLGLDFAVAPYPLATRGGRPIAPLLDFKGLALSRRTEKPVLARRLCQALVSQAFQRRFTSALGKLPASLAAREASRGENPWFSPLSRSAERGIVIPPAGAYPAFKNTMWKLLRFFFTGQMGVDETLSTAQTLIDQALRGK